MPANARRPPLRVRYASRRASWSRCLPRAISQVTAELLRRGRAVRVLDSLSTGSRANPAAVGGDVELVEGEVRSYERSHAAAQGVDCAIPA